MCVCGFTMEGKVAFLLLFAIGLACGQEGKLSVQLSSSSQPVGGTLQVTCHVNTAAIAGGKFIHWIKYLPGDSSPNPIDVGDNAVMNDPFKDYTVTVKEDGEEIFFSLNIPSVKVGDSGKLGCEILGRGLNDSKDFTVIVPPTSVKLKVNGKVVEGDEVQFEENEPASVACVIEGSNPQPQVHLAIGDKDIKNVFDQTTSKSVAEVSHPSGKPGLVKITNDMILNNTKFVPLSEYMGKTLTCSAQVADLEPEISDSFLIKMSIKPRFDCEGIVYSFDGEKKTIDCTVVADPPITDLFWSFQRRVREDTNTSGLVNLTEGKEYGQMEVQKLAEGDSKLEKITALKIARVRSQHFRTYTITAKNAIGTVKKEIKLTEKPKEGYSHTGAGERTSCMFSTVSAMAMITLSWLHL